MLLVFVACAGLWTFLVVPARNAALRTQSKGYLKQIGLASHNIHDVYGHFPPFSPDGSDIRRVTEPVSLHASILPYMEQQRLFKAIDMSVPWNAAVNRRAYSTVVVAYSSDYFGEEIGPDGYALTHFVPNDRIAKNGRGMPMRDISDGVSSTIFIGSVNAAFPAWGDPASGRDPANGFAGGADAFGGPEDIALIGMMDGSVRQVSANTAPEIAEALATPAAGDEVPREFWFSP